MHVFAGEGQIIHIFHRSIYIDNPPKRKNSRIVLFRNINEEIRESGCL